MSITVFIIIRGRICSFKNIRRLSVENVIRRAIRPNLFRTSMASTRMNFTITGKCRLLQGQIMYFQTKAFKSRTSCHRLITYGNFHRVTLQFRYSNGSQLFLDATLKHSSNTHYRWRTKTSSGRNLRVCWLLFRSLLCFQIILACLILLVLIFIFGFLFLFPNPRCFPFSSQETKGAFRSRSYNLRRSPSSSFNAVDHRSSTIVWWGVGTIRWFLQPRLQLLFQYRNIRMGRIYFPPFYLYFRLVGIFLCFSWNRIENGQCIFFPQKNVGLFRWLINQALIITYRWLFINKGVPRLLCRLPFRKVRFRAYVMCVPPTFFYFFRNRPNIRAYSRACFRGIENNNNKNFRSRVSRGILKLHTYPFH